MDPVIQGWCPGALRPMMSGDGLVVRLRVRGGRLTQDQAQNVAALAALFGNGLLDISARANLQIRGVSEANHAPLIQHLRLLDLVDENLAIEARRNIIVAPFWQDGDLSQAIGHKLAKALAAEDAPDLPGKFGFAIDLGSEAVLRHVSADIRFERGTDGLLICTDVGLGKAVTPQTAVSEAIALAHWFIAKGGVKNGRGRMAALLKAQALPEGFSTLRPPQGLPPLPGLTAHGRLVGLEFGQMRSGTLAALATLGALRLTPWRMLLVEGLIASPELDSVITRADDPMLRVVACTGAPGCLQALSETRGLARALAPYVTRTLHVSGCAKGCAHPAAALTLTATPAGFDLIEHGSASGAPSRSGLSPKALIADPTLLEKARS